MPKRTETTYKRTSEMEDRILTFLRAGNSRNVACQCVGLSSRSMRVWMDNDDENEELEDENRFRARVERAEAEALAAAVAAVKRAAVGIQVNKRTVKRYKDKLTGAMVEETTESTEILSDWRAGAWLLERKDPENWKERRDVTSDDRPIMAAFDEALDKIYGTPDALPQPAEQPEL